MNKKIKLAIACAGVAAAALTATGCQNQYNDQNGVRQVSPDFIQTYLNVDGYANVTMLCIDGVGFATTSRDYTSLIPVAGWNSFCATKSKAPDQATRVANPNP